MSKHKEALDILIHELCDFVGAETYCVTNGQSTGVIPDDIQQAAPADEQHQKHLTPPARSSSLQNNVVDKPLPPIKLQEEENEEYLDPEQLNERKVLVTMLFKSYLDIKDR